MNSSTIRQRTLAWPLFALFASPALAQVGINYCGPAVPNSSGQPAVISALGSADLGINASRLTLVAEDLPTNQFGLFFTGRTQGFVANPGGSVGNLCVSGSIGRYRGPGQVLDSGAAGRIELAVDLALTPEGAGFVQVLAGETWNYQAWFRDFGAGGGATSNFTDALEVQFSDSCPTCATVPGMVPIPAGTFLMGSDAPNAAPYFNGSFQQPVHDVTISYSFWMGQYEVTQAEHEAVMGTNPSFFPGASRPVDRVSWLDARAYCAALTAQNAGSLPAGDEYRLPTEAEWEYACRAGTTTEFHYGAELFCNQARFSFSYHSTPAASCSNPNGTVPVGGYAPNAFGLYVMHGNVWEWCLDSFAGYSGLPVTDPFVTGGSNRVFRGGSCSASPSSAGPRSGTSTFPASGSVTSGSGSCLLRFSFPERHAASMAAGVSTEARAKLRQRCRSRRPCASTGAARLGLVLPPATRSRAKPGPALNRAASVRPARARRRPSPCAPARTRR